MEKIIIGVNELQRIKDVTANKRRVAIKNKAMELCKDFLDTRPHELHGTVSDPKFFESFSKYVVNKATEKLGLKKPNLEKVIELTDIPYKQIKRLENDYKLVMNDLLNSPDDYNIYAETKEEIQLFKELQLLCEQLNKYKVKPSFQVLSAFKNRVTAKNDTWIPNHIYIKTIVKNK